MSNRIPVEEQKELKKKHILDAAARVFSTKGYQETKVKDIVEEAGVSVGSFYFYFKSKDEIFEELLDVMVSHLWDVCNCNIQEDDPLELQIERAITSVLQCIINFRELAKIMMIEAIGLNPSFERKRVEKLEFFSRFIQDKLEQALEQGVIPPIDSRVAAYAYVGAVNNVITHWLTHNEPENLLSAAPALIMFNQRGIGLTNCGVRELKENV